ncbi:MAG TPA: hypothetical protein VNK49_05640 [Anaerolineales bacterium]|nr:hypothetical protein [Anaerolineales bacterium]
MKSVSPGSRREWSVLAVGIIWVLLYFGAVIVLRKPDLVAWQKVTVALVPIPPFVVFILSVISQIRSMDELERRVHLEALAIAYPIAIVLLMTLGLLEQAIGLSPDDWSYRHVWPYLPFFYFVGLAFARRRYR